MMFLRKLIRRGIGLLGSCWFVSVCAHPIPDSITVRLQSFASALEQFGKAFIRFYNNSRCQSPRITVETLTEDGKIGVFQ